MDGRLDVIDVRVSLSPSPSSRVWSGASHIGTYNILFYAYFRYLLSLVWVSRTRQTLRLRSSLVLRPAQCSTLQYLQYGVTRTRIRSKWSNSISIPFHWISSIDVQSESLNYLIRKEKIKEKGKFRPESTTSHDTRLHPSDFNQATTRQVFVANKERGETKGKGSHHPLKENVFEPWDRYRYRYQSNETRNLNLKTKGKR